MSGLHAWWTIGAFAGAGAGVLGVAIGLSLTRQLLLIGLPVLVIAGWLTTWMVPDSGRNADPRPARRPARTLSRAVLVLGAIACASMIGEGAAADWAAVYLRGSLHVSAALAGLGYTVFALAMMATRLSGNRLLARFGVRRLLPVLAAVATAGFTAGLLAGLPVTAEVGFGCLGVGLALVVPSVFSAAGRLPGLDPGAAIATVSAFGWAGFVCGPPLIGELAAATSLPVALGLVPVLTAVVAVATALAAPLREDRPAAGGDRCPAGRAPEPGRAPASASAGRPAGSLLLAGSDQIGQPVRGRVRADGEKRRHGWDRVGERAEDDPDGRRDLGLGRVGRARRRHPAHRSVPAQAGQQAGG
jgi:predicted MFS family arabinose efflux permease